MSVNMQFSECIGLQEMYQRGECDAEKISGQKER